MKNRGEPSNGGKRTFDKCGGGEVVRFRESEVK